MPKRLTPKTCNDCGVDIKLKHQYCPPCRAVRTKENARKQQAKKQQEYYDWLHQQGCCCCEENSPGCLEVHHLSKDAPRFRTRGQCAFYNIQDVIKQIAVVLCCNCHNLFHSHFGGKAGMFPDQTIDSTIQIIDLERSKWGVGYPRT